MAGSSNLVGVDIGGTFTDLVGCIDGKIVISKSSTVPADPTQGVADTLRLAGCDMPALSEVLHGSTVAINTVLERKGARTALITTKGFRDVYAIGGNALAARLSGVPVDARLILVYAVSGLMAGAGAIVLAGRMNSGFPLAGVGAEDVGLGSDGRREHQGRPERGSRGDADLPGAEVRPPHCHVVGRGPQGLPCRRGVRRHEMVRAQLHGGLGFHRRRCL